MPGHEDHEVDEKGRCLSHPAVRSRFLDEHFIVIPVGFDRPAKEPTMPDHLTAKYATATLVTDTISFDVVGATEKTVTVRRRRKADTPPEFVGDAGGYGLRVGLHATESVEGADLKVYRMRKDGSFRLGDNYGYFRFTNDPPTERVDYRN